MFQTFSLLTRDEFFDFAGGLRPPGITLMIPSLLSVM